MNQKRILVVSNMYPSNKDPYYGTFVKSFYDDITKIENVAPELVAIKGRAKSMAGKLFNYFRFYTATMFKLLFTNYDLIYVHTISHTSIPLRIISSVKKLNVIFNIHGDDLLTTTKTAHILRNIAIPILKKAEKIVVPTEYFRDVLLREMPFVKPYRIIISPSGGISKRFFVNNHSKKKNEIVKIGYVSRIDQGKGWDILLMALSVLKETGLQFIAEFYGRGAEEDLFRAKVEYLRLNDNVNYYGPKSHDELPTIYKTFDVFVFPTMRDGESLGLVGLEAMAAGVPVIGSDIGGLKSYIKNNVNGMMFIPGDYMGLAEKLKLFFAYPDEKRISMSNEAKLTANEYESTIVNNTLFKNIGIIS